VTASWQGLSNAQLAMAYVRAGFFVFPCSPERRKRELRDRLPFGKADKRPLVSSWSKDASNDPAQVDKWWTESPHALIGLPCKQNKLLVFDADRHTADEDGVAHLAALCEAYGPLPPHPIVSTDYEGEHHIFRMPGEPIGNRKIGIGLETRGYQTNNDGGYIIAAGSRMPDGRGWELVNGAPSLLDGPLPEPPSWLIELCRARKNFDHATSPHSTGKREEAYARQALETQAQKLASTRPGNRNVAANSSAYSIGRLIARGWIGAETVEGRLFDACRRNCLVNEDGEAKVRATLRSGIKAGMQNPHPDLQDRLNDKAGHGSNGSSPNQSSARTFDDPDWSILDDRRGQLPEFPVDVLTPAWRGWLERASHGSGVRLEHTGIPLLGIASSLIGCSRRVCASRSWSEPMTLWTCVVADSGDRKTPGLRAVVRTLDFIEKGNAPKVSEKRLAHETKIQRAKEIKARWKEDRENALKATPPKDAPPMPMDAIDPGNFIEPRLYATDPTIERLAPLLQARPRGMLLIRDELAGLFANMQRYHAGSDRPFWLEAYGGGRHVVERQSGSVVVDHLLVGVVGTFQPDKLARAFGGDEDGMYGRFLYGWPLAPEYRPLTNSVAEVEPELVNALTALIRLPSEDVDGAFAPQSVWLSPDAVAEFEGFRQWHDKAKRGLDGRERHWFAKGENHVLRLAAVLAYMAWAIGLGTGSGLDGITAALEPKTVAKEFMIDAIRLWREFFWPHAGAAMRQIGLTERHADARKALRWIGEQRKAEVSLKDIRRHALNERLDEEHTKAVLSHLERAGWVRKYERPGGPTGGKPVVRWEINPILFSKPGAETAETAET
jgi:hypothetical protein